MSKSLSICLIGAIALLCACEEQTLLDNWIAGDMSISGDLAKPPVVPMATKWTFDFADGRFVDSSPGFSYWYSDRSLWKLGHSGVYIGTGVFDPAKHLYGKSSLVICKRNSSGFCEEPGTPPMNSNDKKSLSYLGFSGAETEWAEVYFGRSISAVDQLTIDYRLVELKGVYQINLYGLSSKGSRSKILSITSPSDKCPNMGTCREVVAKADKSTLVGLSIEVTPPLAGDRYGFFNIDNITIEGRE